MIYILKQRTTVDSLKSYCVRYLREETHSFAYTFSVLRQLDTDIRKEITRLGGNKGLIEILDMLRL